MLHWANYEEVYTDSGCVAFCMGALSVTLGKLIYRRPNVMIVIGEVNGSKASLI